MKKWMWLWACLLLPFFGMGQSFTLELEEMPFPVLPGLHSGAFTNFEGKWVMIGGRVNGLHGFLPPLAFPESGENSRVWIADPQTGQIWSATVDSLPAIIREPITSSGMQFYREDTTLYMVGGYGWQDSIQDFVTFPTLTAIALPGLVQAVMDSTPLTPYFRTLTDQRLAVCGGHLGKIDDTYQLVWGHRFDGIYDEFDTTGFFVQDYTYEIRRFEIVDNGGALSLSNYAAEGDSLNFRRRDYNLVPQRFPNGDFGYTGFTGVFREDLDLPHLTVVDVQVNSFTHQTGFNQTLSQYHSAVMPLWDSQTKDMETVFFGGMSMYKLDSVGNVVVDSLIPFVNTISKVVRDSMGNLSEFALPDTLPGLLGTNQYFFPSDSVVLLEEGIIDLGQVNGRTLAGYLVGGIESPEENISTTDPSISVAHNKVYKVYLDHEILIGYEKPVVAPAIVTAYPNPFEDQIRLEFVLSGTQPITVNILDIEGRQLEQLYAGLPPGESTLIWDASKYPAGVYFYQLIVGGFETVGRMVHK